MKVSSEIRAKLEETGQWKRFCKERTALIVNGRSPKEAYECALNICLGVEGGAPKAGEVNPGSSALSLPAVPAGVWDGKEASEVECIRWVARNMDVLNVRAEDCPDPMAWSLLQRCRTNASFAEDFWKSMFTKIVPNKRDLGEGVEGEMDGEPQLETIEKVKQMAGAAKLSAGEQYPAENEAGFKGTDE